MFASTQGINTQQRSQPSPIPSPIGGLNGRDALAAMNPTDAYQMDNIFPGTSSCDVRNGCSRWNANLTDPIRSLETYSTSDGDHLLAFSKPNIWDVTLKGIQVNKKDNLQSDETVVTMFSTVADSAQFLIITTGSDVPMSYDGAAIADLAITGTVDAPDTFHCVQAYMGRLFFGCKTKLGFYYLAPGAIQGAAEFFDLGQISLKGGYLQAIATFTQDGGNGPNDYIVFITSNGEYIMYHGIDPGSVDNWALTGRYRSAEPIGRKCVADYAGDLIILTTEGALQFSAIQKSGDTRSEITSLTSKLGDLLLKRSKAYQSTYGWDMCFYPTGGWFVVNVPATNSEAGDFDHFVMNAITQAWCRFYSSKWNALCWCIKDRKLYFGRYDGKIMLADDTQYDDGDQINFRCKQAYNNFGSPQHKLFHWGSILLASDAPALMSASMNVDFKEQQPVATGIPVPGSQGALWDTIFWDTEYWAQGEYTQDFVQAFNQFGIWGSLNVQGNVNGVGLKWYSTTFVWEEAKGLL